MPEPVSIFTATLLGTSLSSLLSMIKDETLKLAFEKNINNVIEGLKDNSSYEKRLQNHDLQRATIKSFYKALERISTDCLHESTKLNHEYRDDLSILKNAVEYLKKNLNKRIKAVEKDDNPDAPFPQEFSEISQLLAPNVELVKDRVDNLEDLLIRTALTFELPSEAFPVIVRRSIYDYTKKFFALEIKENSRVRDIFLSQQVVDISNKTDEILVQTGYIFAVISEYVGTSVSTNEKIEEMYDILLELRLTNEKANNSSDLAKIQFRINNAEHIENFNDLFNNLHRVGLELFEMKEQLDFFLDNYKNYPEDTVNEKQKYDLDYERKMEEVSEKRDLKSLVELAFSNPYVEYRTSMRDKLATQVNMSRIKSVSQSFNSLIKFHSIQIKQAFAVPSLEILKQLEERLNNIVLEFNTSGSPYSNLFHTFEGKLATAGFSPFNEDVINALHQLQIEFDEIGTILKDYIDQMNKGISKIF